MEFIVILNISCIIYEVGLKGKKRHQVLGMFLVKGKLRCGDSFVQKEMRVL